MLSNHYSTDRQARETLIRDHIGIGKVIKSVQVDRGHKNGAEIHKITNTGIILIYNAKTNKLVTKLIARPNQIRRYYNNPNQVPQALIKLAIDHTNKGYNLI